MYESTKYFTTKEFLKEILQTYGVAIIPNVLNTEECNSMLSGMWDYFEHISMSWEIPINRNNKDTWREFYKLYPLHSMLIQHWNVGHAQVSWDVRQNEKIVDVFSHFWGCKKEDLLVSFDGLSFHFPPEITKKGWNRNHLWLHCDQRFTENDFKCVQSWVTALDVHENDSTLAFLEGSHHYHKEFAETNQITDHTDWYKLKEEEESFYREKGCLLKKICCPKGSLVFWDSRTIHCGVEANKERNVSTFRAVIYLCYMPRNVCSDKNLKKKQKAFLDLRTTSHYPCHPKLFPKYPRTYGNKIPEITMINPPIVNDLGRTLSGF
jgi:hypothetical protein